MKWRAAKVQKRETADALDKEKIKTPMHMGIHIGSISELSIDFGEGRTMNFCNGEIFTKFKDVDNGDKA